METYFSMYAPRDIDKNLSLWYNNVKLNVLVWRIATKNKNYAQKENIYAKTV